MLISSVLLYCTVAQSQLVSNPVSSAYLQTGAYSNSFTDPFSFSGNAAALAKAKKFSAGLFSEQRFLLKELTTYTMAVALPETSGNFGLAGTYCGQASYNTTTLGLAYAKALGSKLDVGVQFNYNAFRAAGYGAASGVSFNAGTIFHINEALQTGFQLINPIAMNFGKGAEEKLPYLYSAGLGYTVSPQFFISTEIQKTENQPVTINAGFQYIVADKLIMRAGLSSATSIYYIGFGLPLKNLRLHATVSFHPYLGVTPGLLLVYTKE